jgi:hypothetical protein
LNNTPQLASVVSSSMKGNILELIKPFALSIPKKTTYLDNNRYKEEVACISKERWRVSA